MPHIIVEYSEQISQQIAIKDILQNIHESVASSGIFKAAQIKTRAYPFTDFTHAGTTEPYIHIQARIKSGRDIENKKRFSSAILLGLKKLKIPNTVITLEVIDMERHSYGKLTS